jgi:DNA mismatch repair ATPase MutL
MEDIGSDCSITSQSGQEVHQEVERKIGGYTLSERREKILKYKLKLQKWRRRHPVSKKFQGRSKVASTKPRINGRFVKKSELERMIKEGVIVGS